MKIFKAILLTLCVLIVGSDYAQNILELNAATSSVSSEKQLLQKIIEYLYKIPQLLGLLVFSFFSGQIWLWIIFAFYKSTAKGDKYLTNKYAKTALGLLWFAVLFFPCHITKHGLSYKVGVEVFDLIGFVIVFGLFLQGLCFTAILLINKKK